MDLPIPHNTFITFLLNAKRHTYVVQGDDATVTPLLPSSRQLEYRNGVLLYRDIYFGLAHFAGQEVVYHDTSPIWAMCYSGGLVPSAVIPVETKQVYAFLRAALSQVESKRPYRGPNIFQENAYIYTDESQGNIEYFWGVETITYNNHLVYHLRYSGGLIS